MTTTYSAASATEAALVERLRAEFIASLRTAPLPGPVRVYLHALPDWLLDALLDVLDMLRRARVDEPGTWELRELLVMLGETLTYPKVRTPEGMVADLERIAAVLALDIPAARVLATALERCPVEGGARTTRSRQAGVEQGDP
ncbi:hypothetical protein [Kitasatospora sp. McL0602]|uniref:hypothetical protein n=1 Tax=Kitasatospora sp. McL0602 TaxID=3439530 RepID=UPI003F89F021